MAEIDNVALERAARGLVAAYLAEKELGQATWYGMANELGAAYRQNSLVGVAAVAAGLYREWQEITGDPWPWLCECVDKYVEGTIDVVTRRMLDECNELIVRLLEVPQSRDRVQEVAGSLGLKHGPAALEPLLTLVYVVCSEIGNRAGVTALEIFQAFALHNERHVTELEQ